MSIVINGSGTISGLVSGGLPDGSIATADIADAAITAAKMSGGQSGSAPVYAARAWVNFNGTGTVAIRASGNVSSITDNGTGDYTVNFATAMPDANYSATGSGTTPAVSAPVVIFGWATAQTASAIRLGCYQYNGPALVDQSFLSVAIFR